jgi:transmembrane sensor
VVELTPAARRPQARPDRRSWIAAAAALAACAAVAAFVAPRLIGGGQPEPVVYATAPGETRTVALADGSRIVLNSGTRLSVALTNQRRSVTLDRGEAAFAVAHDPARPFVVAAADRQIRDIGTEFNVLRTDGRLTVTVRQGVVAVDPAPQAQGETMQLTAGQQLVHAEGQAASTIAAVDPEHAFAWRAGRLVYQDRPLGEVAADLGRYFQRPIHVDAAIVSMRFTGVLFIDDQEAMVRRLEKFLPIRAEVSPNEIRLSPGEAR